MNNRQFDAAHDRYMDPPDEEFDDTTDDEMDLADIRRQNQIDHEDWLAQQLHLMNKVRLSIEALQHHLPEGTRPCPVERFAALNMEDE